jgi:hypothetical protein
MTAERIPEVNREYNQVSKISIEIHLKEEG